MKTLKINKEDFQRVGNQIRTRNSVCHLIHNDIRHRVWIQIGDRIMYWIWIQVWRPVWDYIDENINNK